MLENPPTVYLVDDDPSVLGSLSRVVRAAGLEVVASSSAEAFLSATIRRPSCVVVDLRMPGLGGLDLQSELTRRGATIPIIFLTAHGDVRSSVQAMKGGAVDFLLKPIEPDQLITTIRAALDRSRADVDAAERTAALRRHLEALTPREREVLSLVVRGLSNKQVGVALGAAEKTIKVHRGRIMQKMAAGSLAELVQMAVALGLLDSSASPSPVAEERGSPTRSG